MKVVIKWDFLNGVKLYGMYIAMEEDAHWDLKKSQERDETLNGSYIYPVQLYLKNKRKQ